VGWNFFYFELGGAIAIGIIAVAAMCRIIGLHFILFDPE